jgi:uncharacterized membrane protein (DUF106 family)
MQRLGRRRGEGVGVNGIDFLVDLLKTALGFIFGTLVSAIITGLLINRFVIKKIMANKDIQDIIKLIRDVKNEMIQHNKNGKNTLPGASDYKDG